MTIRSLTMSLTAIAVVTVFGVGCAQSTSPPSSSTAYTPTAASMGNDAVSPDNTTSMSGSGNMAQSGSTGNDTMASRGTMDNSGTSTGSSAGSSTGSSTGMTTNTAATANSTGTGSSSSMNGSDNDNVMRAARADRN